MFVTHGFAYASVCCLSRFIIVSFRRTVCSRISSYSNAKVNKIDIVGFLSNKGELKKEDIGLIEVKDFFSFVAVKKIKVSHTLQLIKDQKLKNKKVKIAVAK